MNKKNFFVVVSVFTELKKANQCVSQNSYLKKIRKIQRLVADHLGNYHRSSEKEYKIVGIYCLVTLGEAAFDQRRPKNIVRQCG